MKFIFIRHGKTHFNEINLTQGWCDSPLSKLGVKQVENMSLQLKDYSINKAYTSPLGRAVETSEIILQGHNNLTFLSACGSKAHIEMNNSCLCRHLILYFN